jgi:hypothetical protein
MLLGINVQAVATASLDSRMAKISKRIALSQDTLTPCPRFSLNFIALSPILSINV